MSRNRVQALVGSIVIVSCLASIFYIYSRPSKNGFGAEHDFVTVVTGAHCLVAGCDPYDAPTLEREFPKMGGYTPTSHFKPEWPVYPPSTFLLLFPFSLLPWSVLSVVWLLLSFGFLSAAFVVLFLRCKAYRDLLSALPFVILLADGSIGWAVELGQPVLIAASSLTLAIVALESGSMPIVGGLLLAISLCLKPQGAYLCVAYFLLRSSTRIPALAACFFTAAIGAAGTAAFLLPAILVRLPWASLFEPQAGDAARKRCRLFACERGELFEFSQPSGISCSLDSESACLQCPYLRGIPRTCRTACVRLLAQENLGYAAVHDSRGPGHARTAGELPSPLRSRPYAGCYPGLV